MARSAKQAKRPAAQASRRRPVRKRRLSAGMAAIGNVIARNPAATGGSTALLIALFFVSANALWYQPHAHRDAFFKTRDFVRTHDQPPADPENETTFLIERPLRPAGNDPSQKSAPVDPVTRQVQGVLKELGFYDGRVDGMSGPATSKAIDTYRRKVGLSPAGSVDHDLLVQLGVEPTTAGIAPIPAPRAVAVASAGPDDQVALTRKVQAGLKAFGSEDIDVDGMMGAKTENAIREFQTIFGLPVTGEPDKALYAKMNEAGLTD